jgi:hypothetical protein
MSGIVGHSMYAVLGLHAAESRRLPLVRIARAHMPSYLAGAYLGSDIQVMPEAVCVDTGREVGFGTVPLEKSPLTGGAVRQYRLATPEGPLTPRQVHERFYGRAHLVFGFTRQDASLHVPWDHLPEYFAAVLDDAVESFGANERSLAYALGWIVHVVSDSLIKGIHPGIELQLLDGRYTQRNRPVQDLVTFHEVGIREFRLDWSQMFRDMADTPVEPVQLHYMRCASPRGHLAKLFDHGWLPGAQGTVEAVLAENRRWVRHHAADVLKDMELCDGDCKESIRALTGLSYAEMVQATAKAGFRRMLANMGDHIAGMFEAVLQRSPKLAALASIKK